MESFQIKLCQNDFIYTSLFQLGQNKHSFSNIQALLLLLYSERRKAERKYESREAGTKFNNGNSFLNYNRLRYQGSRMSGMKARYIYIKIKAYGNGNAEHKFQPTLKINSKKYLA